MNTFLEYATRGRNAWWRYILATALALVIAMALSLGVGTALQLAGQDLNAIAAALQDPSRPIAFFLCNGALFGLLAIGFLLAIGLIHRKRFGDLVGAWSMRLFLAGIGVWALALVFATLVDFGLAPSGFSITASDQTWPLAAAAVAGLAVQTFAEEYVFRGYLTQGLLLAIKRPLPTALVSGVLFGALHIPNGTPQAVSATIFGVVLALIAIRTGGLAFTYGLHLANNFFGAAVIVSSHDAFKGSPALITQNTPHLMWWDTAMGAVLLILLAVGFAKLGVGPPTSRLERKQTA